MIYTKLKQKVTSLFILLCLLFASSAEALKVISSNLLHEYAYNNYLKAKNLKIELATRNKKFKAFLKQEKADIICLQEFHEESWKAIVEEFAQENDYTLLEELNPDAREGLKTRLGILINNKTIESKGKTYTNKHAKIMSQRCLDKTNNQEFVVFNIHAPWGQGGKKRDQTEKYKKCIKFAGKLPIIAVGDWNTDGNPEDNKNKEILLETVFSPADGFEDISNGLAHTARSVHAMDDAQKIDYVVTRGFKKPQLVTTEPPHSPQGFNLLLPHTDNSNGASSFNPKSPDNHWSDHAAVIVDFDIAEQNKQEPVKPEQQQQPQQKIDNKNKPVAQEEPNKENPKPINKKNGANARFEHKGKVLLAATGLTMAYATHQICQKKLKNKKFSATEYAKTFITTFAELTTVQHSMKTTEQKLFTAALTALVGGEILLHRN